jgi:HSP20 family protein
MLTKSGSVKGELERMRREMDRIWERFSQESSIHEREWNPSLDLMELEANLVAEVEVPGINPDDIDISVTADMLTVSGEKKQESLVQEKNYHVVERAYGRFSRSIPLPTAVNPDQVEARYKDGILKITMGKSEAAKSKRIEVKTE